MGGGRTPRVAGTNPSPQTPGMCTTRHSAAHVECLDADMVAVYRAMTPAQRVATGLSATDLIRDHLSASLRELHPDWTSEAISRAVSQRMLGAGD